MFERRKKSSSKTRKFRSAKKKKVMSETLEYLAELRELFEQKQVA